MTDRPDPPRAERIEVRLTAAELAAWQALAKRSDQPTLAALIREAVKRFGERETDWLADLGRDVVEAVDARRPSKRRQR